MACLKSDQKASALSERILSHSELNTVPVPHAIAKVEISPSPMRISF